MRLGVIAATLSLLAACGPAQSGGADRHGLATAAGPDADGDGIVDSADACPNDPEDFDDFEDDNGCPDPDNDNDGIPDLTDHCPTQPETKNSFEDEDGCPDSSPGADRDGDGIGDAADKCPDEPEDSGDLADNDGCPGRDSDNDGILNLSDLCPDDPEDMDGYQDDDGCPDPDNDHDRILDVDDQCPGQAETYNGIDDDDGCPDKGRVIVTDTKIEILDKVYFETGSAAIKGVSHPIIDAVVATLRGNPEILLVEIQGHTDDQETPGDRKRLELSEKRAEAVAKYLVAKGIAAKRIQPRGYGDAMPIAAGKSASARAKNRRVEFLILKRSN